MPKLVISLPDAGEVIHELTDAHITVGRVDDNRIQIDDVSVSSHHAELTRGGSGYILKDIGSTNGTFLNGDPVAEGEEHPLSEGDRIRFGKVETIFESGARKESPAQIAGGDAVSTPAQSSQRPNDFGSASLFSRKKKKADPVGLVGIGLCVLGLLAAGAVAYIVTGVQPPQF